MNCTPRTRCTTASFGFDLVKIETQGRETFAEGGQGAPTYGGPCILTLEESQGAPTYCGHIVTFFQAQQSFNAADQWLSIVQSLKLRGGGY